MNLDSEISDPRLDSQEGWWWSRVGSPAQMLTIVVMMSVAGCAAVKPVAPPFPAQPAAVETKAPRTTDKQESALRQFEERRDSAQLGAAIDRWKLGDSPGSEALLLQLLARNPTHREARLTLADLYVAKPNPAAAFAELHHLLQENPADAQSHHSLGLLLDSENRREEALRHLEEALRLDPKNELYALSLESCRER